LRNSIPMTRMLGLVGASTDKGGQVKSSLDTDQRFESCDLR
jgi:hypothetical protein